MLMDSLHCLIFRQKTSTIQVQYLGYKVETLVLTPEMVKGKITILLIPDNNQLDEVVVSNDSGQQIVKMNKSVSQISLSPKKVSIHTKLGRKRYFQSYSITSWCERKQMNHLLVFMFVEEHQIKT